MGFSQSGGSPAAQAQGCTTDCTTPPPPSGTLTKTASVPKAQLDVILIVDDSESMIPDQSKLKARMANFLSTLSAANVDWQVCYSTTDVADLQGHAIPWVTSVPADPTKCDQYNGNDIVINSSTPNLQTVINNTFQWIGCQPGSADSRGIAAFNMMVADASSASCFRSGAALATILLSNADERVTGGNCALDPALCPALQSMDLPATAVNNVKSLLGGRAFTFNSIVVSDNQCLQTESQQSFTINGQTQYANAYIGQNYLTLANNTGGYAGSICASDYTANLTYIKNRVLQTLPSVTLDCAPVGTPTYVYAPNFTTTATVNNKTVSFNPALPEGTTVTITYKCQ